jgi:hypothetical protein
MTNVATLKPNKKGTRRGGRQPGVQNLTTRVLKHALLLAAEESKHSDGSLKGYCLHLANERPELFVSMLARLIPVQAKIDSDVRIDFDKIRRLTAEMPLDEMVRTFEEKIKSPDYVPRSLLIDQNANEHDDDSDDE